MVKVGRLETHREDKMKRFKEYTDNKVDIIQGGRIDMISLVCAHLLFISYAHISCSYKSHLTARCRSTLYLYCKSWSMEERGWCIVMIVCRMITLLQGEWEWGGFDLASPAISFVCKHTIPKEDIVFWTSTITTIARICVRHVISNVWIVADYKT